MKWNEDAVSIDKRVDIGRTWGEGCWVGSGRGLLSFANMAFEGQDQHSKVQPAASSIAQ